MNEVVRFPVLKTRTQLIQSGDRDALVMCMAEHLVSAILHDGMDTSNDSDVIMVLFNTPERFQSRIILNHMDDAMYEAKQLLIQREMGNH